MRWYKPRQWLSAPACESQACSPRPMWLKCGVGICVMTTAAGEREVPNGLSQGIEIPCDVPGLGFGNPHVRHRSVFVHLLRRLDPPDHVGRRVRQHTRDVDAIRDPPQRRTNQSIRAWHARNRVARWTAIVTDECPPPLRITTRQRCRLSRHISISGGKTDDYGHQAAHQSAYHGSDRMLVVAHSSTSTYCRFSSAWLSRCSTRPSASRNQPAISASPASM
jgi:hypothetical protein